MISCPPRLFVVHVHTYVPVSAFRAHIHICGEKDIRVVDLFVIATIMSRANSSSDGPADDAQGSTSQTPSINASQLSTPAPAKSWLARSLGAVMQLPKSTPLSVLRWTTPEGPMPLIVHLPSREKGRTVEVYIWVPPNHETRGQRNGTNRTHSPASSHQSSEPQEGSAERSADDSSQDIQPRFHGKQRPCVVDFHGGGFTMGGPLEQAPWCAALARSGIIAVSVAYRLGPTWEFPAALHDAEDAVRAVLNVEDPSKEAGAVLRQAIQREAGGTDSLTIDPQRVALTGFSSGGNVALNMLLDLSEQISWPSPFPTSHNSPIPAILFFPSLDARIAPHERQRPPGMRPPGSVSRFLGETLRNAYIPPDKVAHLRASPGLAPPSALHSATRSLLILPELDSLAEQSNTWVGELRKNGILQEVDNDTGQTIGRAIQHDGPTVRVHRIKGMTHGFTTYPDTFLDHNTRYTKALVMEQCRRWLIIMLGAHPPEEKELHQRVQAIARGEQHTAGPSQPTAKMAE